MTASRCTALKENCWGVYIYQRPVPTCVSVAPSERASSWRLVNLFTLCMWRLSEHNVLKERGLSTILTKGTVNLIIEINYGRLVFHPDRLI